MILNNETRKLVETLKENGQMDAVALVEMIEEGFARLSISAQKVLANETFETAADIEKAKDKEAADTACEVVATCEKSRRLLTELTEDTLLADLFPDAFEVPNRWSELKPLLFKECA